MSQQVRALSPSKAITSLKEVGYPPADLNIPQHIIQIFLTSILVNLELRLFPGSISNIQWSHFPNIVQIFPGESNPVSPGKLGSISPSSKLIPSRFWKLIPIEYERVPWLYSRVISLPGYNWVILSQKPQKDRPRRSLLIPSEVY